MIRLQAVLLSFILRYRESMAAPYQTVIYEVASGRILEVFPNLYVSSKPQLAKLAGLPRWQDVAFVYFPFDMPIDPLQIRVRRLSSNMPASLVNVDGLPLDFSTTIHNRRKALKQGQTCLVEFEGGMGDQLMEAAAVLTAMSKYKASTFFIRAQSQYIQILNRVPGIPAVNMAYVGQAKAQFTMTVSNHTQYISDPRGGMYGKASLYGAWLGLERVSKVAKIKLSPADYQTESAFLEGLPLKDRPFNFMCQFRSGSGHGKSWQHQKVVRLAELLKGSFDCNVYAVGRPNEMPAGAPHIVDLTGRSTWWQTCLLESKMDLVICIDSGVMHLARSLSVPYVCLWGGTNAQVILGENESPSDIRLDLPCKDLVCYDCPKRSNACMVNITPEMAVAHARVLLHHAGDQLPGS